MVDAARFGTPDIRPAETDIRAFDVVKRYGGTQVLGGVSLEVARGASVALIGSNGAGKSTLMRACAGLTGIDGGSIEVMRQPVSRLGGAALRRMRSEIGFVFQKHNLTPRLSALTNVVHGALGRQWGPRLWTQRAAPPLLREEAMACLEQVGLAQVAGQRCDTLSGGQSQRVAIARMLMQRPRLIMADEPVASLDPTAGREVMELLVRLTAERGLTLLFSSHHLEHACLHAERIVALKAGVVIFDDAPERLSSELVRHIYG